MSVKFLKQAVFSKARVLVSALALLAASSVLPSIFFPRAAAQAATLTVNSLADPGATGVCALRDAIAAANTNTATNGCPAGDSNDSIQFSVNGTILLANTLPQITDHQLTINGPGSPPGITINGENAGVNGMMQVASGARLNLKNLLIANGSNPIGAGGGGIINFGMLTVANCTFSGNSSIHSNGAGIANYGTVSVGDSIFSGNTGGVGGGIFNTGRLTVTNSIFSQNEASGRGGGFDGGAIYNSGTLAVTNSTFSANTADEGGGVFNAGTLIVTNTTFSGNTGGDIFNELNAVSAIVKNSIMAGSTGGNCSGTIDDAGYNISNDASCGFSATGSLNNTDPMLDPAGLSNNGGPMQTIALVPGSPAIDAIPLASCTDQSGNPVTTDQRGFPRPDAGEDVCDIGAYEFQDNAATSAVTITVPAAGGTVSGKLSIVAQVSAAVSWIDVYIDGIYLASSPPYSFSWDSASVADGLHTISATAFDGSGTAIGNSSITVSVDNVGPTPGVTITAPNNGATVSGKVIIATQVSGRVSWIDVYIDGIYLTSSPPDSFTWDSSSVGNGSHTISVTAFNGSDMEVGSSLIALSVAN